MKYVATVFILFIGEIIFAQAPLVKQWDKRFGGTLQEFLTSFQQTADGGYILGGWSLSDSTGDKTQPSRGGYDYWIVKTDSLGNKQWDKRFGGTYVDILFSLQQTTDRGFILGGVSSSDSSGDKTQHTRGGYDYWLVKTDSMGNKQWDKTFGGTDDDHLFSLQQTTDKGFILGGYSDSDSSGDKTQHSRGALDYWIVKTDSLGNKQWDKRFGGADDDELFSLQQTADRGFILGGFSTSDSSGDKTQHSRGRSDYWLVKTDSMGNKQWDKRLGGTGDDDLHSLQQTADKGFILGGCSRSDSSGDKTVRLRDSLPQIYASDFWLVKIDSDGNKQWDKKFGGLDTEDAFGSVTITNDSGYLLAGASYSAANGDKSETNLSREQTWVVKTDSAGNKQWDKTLHTLHTVWNIDDGIGLAIQTRDGCYVMANWTNSIAGGDKTENARNSSQDYWFIKFCDTTQTVHCNLAPPVVTASVTQICANDTAQVCAPTGFINYHWNHSETSPCINATQAGNYYVTVTDNNGCTAESNHLALQVYPLPSVSISVNGDTLTVYNAITQQWYLNGNAISGATDSIYIAHTGGSYMVQVTDTNGCIATSTPVIVSGVDNLTEDEVIIVFPNPSHTAWQLTVGDNFVGSTAELTDVSGKLVFQQLITNLPAGQAGHQSLITPDVASGVYFLRITSGKSSVVRKLVRL